MTDINGRPTFVNVTKQKDMIIVGLDLLPAGNYILRLVTTEGTVSHLVVKGN
jgi:hypothetical protein